MKKNNFWNTKKVPLTESSLFGLLNFQKNKDGRLHKRKDKLQIEYKGAQ